MSVQEEFTGTSARCLRLLSLVHDHFSLLNSSAWGCWKTQFGVCVHRERRDPTLCFVQPKTSSSGPLKPKSLRCRHWYPTLTHATCDKLVATGGWSTLFSAPSFSPSGAHALSSQFSYTYQRVSDSNLHFQVLGQRNIFSSS